MDQQGVLHCEVCDAELPNFNSMQWHIKGKRHQKALEFWKKKQEQAKLSIFVRGYPMGTTEQELWQYFAQFGRVTKVTIVKPKNLYAIIEFSTPDTVNYVLETPNHRLNSQNLVVKPREVEVPGKPASNQMEYDFQQFRRGGELNQPYTQAASRGRGGQGPMRGRGGGPSMLAFGRSGYQNEPPMHGGGPGRSGYQNEPPMHGGGPKATWFGGPVTYREDNRVKGKPQGVDDQIDAYYHEELLEKLVRVKGVQNQLEWLCQNLQVTAEEAQAKFTLCEKLQACLGQFFPGCTVNQFGSSVNGFGLTGCDMDIFLDLTTMHSRTWEVQPIQLPFVRDLKFLKEKEWGPLIPKDLERMGMGDQCKLISRILNDNLKGIMDCQVVPSGKCPLVRFKYGSTGIKCDLSVNNKLALQNTKLLYLFSVLNSRVRLLVYAIRYWGKIKGVAGNAQNSTKLSNYALTLMVLNYLQTVEPPVLPTVEKLSNLHGPANRSRIEGWDTTFAMDWQIIPQSNNKMSAAELLSGFFSFWSAFNFTDNVLCTRTAQEKPFTEFFEKDNMSDGRIRSFKAAAVNIQDPFVLSHNLTQNTNDKSREKIIREFRIAAIKTSVWGNEGFSTRNPSGGGDLVHLLNSEVPDIIQLEDQEKQEQINEKGRMPTRRDDGQYVFEIEMKPQQMNSKILKQLQKGPNYRVEWCKRMCFFICRILKEVLLLTIEDLPEATEEVQAKVKEEMEKKAAADKRNADIIARREAKREAKRKEVEARYQAKLDEMKASMKSSDEKGEEEDEGVDDMDIVETGPGAAGAAGATDGAKETGKDGAEGAKAGEKRPRPVSIFDIEVDVPKRFKGKRQFQFSIDDYVRVSDDSDDEEIIVYKPDLPDLKYKRPSTAEVDQQYFMRAWCMTWARRKKVKNYLVTQESRREEGLAMEKLISSTIYQNDQAPLPKPVVGFFCYLESVVDGNDTKLTVAMECKEGGRDFQTFFQFTKIFLFKMIEKYFN